MKTKIRNTVLIGIIITLMMSVKANATWFVQNTGTTNTIWGVQFKSADVGWIIGSNGMIKKSTDGGETWTTQTSGTTQTLRRIRMDDDNNGFICGHNGTILKTTNGGTSWTLTDLGTFSFYGMDLASPSNVFCAGDDKNQAKTTNRGTSWTTSIMSGIADVPDIYGVTMLDASNIFICTQSIGNPSVPKIYKTTNGGTNWTLVLSLPSESFTNVSLNDILFINSTTGFTGGTNGKLLRTTDAGISWDTAFLGSFDIRQIDFDDAIVFVCGAGGNIAYTTDYGNNWTLTNAGVTSNNLQSVFFFSGEIGWCGGSNGTLIKTVDGGGIFCSLNDSSWVKKYNQIGNGPDEINKIVTDDCGNVYATGYGTNPGPNKDYLTIKYNSSGVQKWLQKYTGGASNADAANSIAIDNFGNVYVTGYSTVSSLNTEYVTIKYNPKGHEQWLQRYDGSGSGGDFANSIAVDNSGNVFVTGNSGGHYATIKYNSSGTQQWVQIYNNGNLDIAEALEVDSSGNVYVTGFSGGAGTNIDFATIKYNSSGVQQWVQRYNGPNNGVDKASSIKVDSLGNVIVIGESDGGGTGKDYATIKYNSSGVQQWVQRYNGPGNLNDVPNSISIDNSNNVYVTGYTTITVAGTNTDYATLKYNQSGVLQWVSEYNGTANSSDEAKSIAIDNSNNVYVTGKSIGSGTSSDFATIKYNSSGVIQRVQRFNGTSNQSDEANSIALDNLGNVFAAGKSFGTGTDFDFAVVKYSSSDFNPITLQLTELLEGFYNQNSNTMISDTVSAYLRNNSSPYSLVDSAKGVLNNLGNGTLNFGLASNGVNYYLVVKHRNTIETWSASGVTFTSGNLSYNFTTSASQAFGNNMIQVDSSPLRFGIYSGDVNQDGVVDATDAGAIDNDAFNFVTGYVNTDITGDDLVDASDAAIADNNAANFVSLITP